jgi:tetratricopeptide (TPR) repeat protein
MAKDDEEQPCSAMTPEPAASPVQHVWQCWRQQQCPDFDAFGSGGAPLDPTQELAVLRFDQHERWRNGERKLAETYLHRYQLLRADGDAACVLIYSEFLLRQELGEAPALNEYLLRFPHYAEELREQHVFNGALLANSSPAARPTMRAPPSLLAASTQETVGSAKTAPHWPTFAGYEIVDELGRGGMGIVYKARQLGLNRVVALKMLRPGDDTSADQLMRFAREAEAVARLQHPHIVQIHEVGHQDGRPYFALEYVAGGSLDKKLAGKPQPARSAARLVETLAQAMHTAHQNKIVHRDLKPANILLSGDADTPLDQCKPKISDFGLAKELNVPLGQTQSGVVMGTPSYMAPEQASGRSKGVGPAADVYALGAVLYEMLTGRPPFQGETALDILQQVVLRDPVPPHVLQPKVPRDLETVCLKCLQKDVGGRYATAAALAEDLRRWQAGEPITARPASSAERLGRWARRKPALASLTAVLALVLIGGFPVVTWLWLRAEHQRGVAEANQAQADADFKLARESVDKYATRVSESLRLRREDLRPLRKELLETVVPFYEQLLQRHGDNDELQAERGRAYARLGAITEDIEDLVKAGALYEQGLAIFEDLAGRHPGVGDYQAQLAKLRTSLGSAYVKTGRNALAETQYQQGLKAWERLAPELPDAVDVQLGTIRARIGLAGLYAKTGRIPSAQAEYQRALQDREDLGRQDSDLLADHQQVLALGHHDLAGLCLRTGQLSQAEAELGRALEIQQRLVARHPHVSDYQHGLCSFQRTSAEVHQAAGRLPQARAEYRKALDVGEALVREHPSVLDYLETLAECRQALASLDAFTKETSSLELEFRKAQEILASLARQQPRVTTYQERLARAHSNLARLCRTTGRWSDGVAEAKKAVEILATLAGQRPEVDAYQDDLLCTHMIVGLLYLESRQYDEAAAEFQEALEIGKLLVRQQPRICKYQDDLATCHLDRGKLFYETDRKPLAEAELLEGLEIRDNLCRQQPQVLAYQVGLAKNHNGLAVLYVDAHRYAEADTQYGKALAIVERLLREQPEVVEYAVMLGGYQANLGILEQWTDKVEASLETFASAIRTLEAVRKKDPQHVRAKAWLCSAHWDRAVGLVKLARYPEAVRDWDQSLALDDGQRRDTILALRAGAMAHAGDPERAMSEVQAVAQEQSVKPSTFYKLAWACCAAAEAVHEDDDLQPIECAKLSEQYGARGVEMLAKADAAGHFQAPANLENFKTDVHLDVLRSRRDFQKLLGEVEEKAKGQPGKRDPKPAPRS